MTVTVTVQTHIERPTAAVFAALADVEHYPAWLIASGITRVERPDAGPLVLGSRVRISQTVAGRSTVLDGEVTEFTPDVTFGLSGKDSEGVTVDIHAGLQSEGQSTGLEWSIRVRLPLRYRMFESMVTPQARRAAILDLEALKLRLESATTG